MQSKSHWENVYTSKAATQVSWFQEHAEKSLQLITRHRPPPAAAVIDVGGGASTLVDDLLDAGYRQLTVLELSGAAIATARARLGDRAAQVQWLEADVLTAELPAAAFDVWHDRAVFHFLTSAEERADLCAAGAACGEAGWPGDRRHLRGRWPHPVQWAARHAL